MKSKYLSFAKNAGIGALAGLAAGAGVSELADLISDNHTANAIASTISEYVAAYSAFLPLHARDNKDIYTKENGRFNWKSFIKDQAKLAGCFVILDIVYLTGRPYLAKEFLESGIEPAKASLYADFISYPALFAASFPIAKITGNIRKANSDLNDNKT